MSTLETNLIQPSSGTTLTLGASGDTITIPSGVTLSGFGANTPAFFVKQSSSQDIAYNTLTQLVFGTEVYDTAGAFASNTFTVPSGQAGKYFLYGRLGWVTANDFDNFSFRIYVNGSQLDDGAVNSNYNQNTTTYNYSLNLSVGDTVNAYAYHNYSPSNLITYADRTNFGGYKLIGA